MRSTVISRLIGMLAAISEICLSIIFVLLLNNDDMIEKLVNIFSIMYQRYNHLKFKTKIILFILVIL